MWMTNPECMCQQHLLGEHLELHMFATHLRNGKGIAGFIKSNCIEPGAIKIRHDLLVKYMKNHNTPIEQPNLSKYSKEEREAKVDVKEAGKLLYSRCGLCNSIRMDT